MKRKREDGQVVDWVLSKEELEALSPQQVIDILKEGNQRFVEGETTHRDHPMQVREAVEGQWPMAIVLGCVDSRVPVEDVFDLGIGDIFVARVAGNFVNEDMLGSMEYACKVVGSKLVLVLGHEHCGAVKSACDGVELGNITALLSKVKPAVEAHADYEGDRSSGNPEFVHMVAEKNVALNIERIRAESPILAELEREGTIGIAGAIYNMGTGTVTFL